MVSSNPTRAVPFVLLLDTHAPSPYPRMSHNSSPGYSTRPLFGGGLSISLPSNVIDAR